MQCDVADLVDEDVMRDVQPGIIILVAMLSDQIQSLGRYRRLGMWSDDPSEIGDWIRRYYSRLARGGDSCSYINEIMGEWKLWGCATDSLIEALERDTVIRIDRGRICSLARAYSIRDEDTIERRQKRRQGKRVNNKRRGICQVARSNRAA